MANVVALCGGFGGARFLLGLREAVSSGRLAGIDPDTPITAIVNTGDDWWVHGLKVCPDLDTVMYTLGDGIDTDRGWGRRDESWQVSEELRAYGVARTWFGLGDRDIATHLVRTQMLEAGFPLSAVTEALCTRWEPGVAVLPMTDDRVETHVEIDDPDAVEGRRLVHFQEYWVRLKAEPAVRQIRPIGLDSSTTPAPGVLEAVADAAVVFLPPSNPVVSIGPILDVPGVRDALAGAEAPVVGLSPIVGGSHVRGMAAQLLTSIGVEVSAAGVGLHYGSDLLDGWLVDTRDADQVHALEAAGISALATGLMMTSPEETARMATQAWDLVRG